MESQNIKGRLQEKGMDFEKGTGYCLNMEPAFGPPTASIVRNIRRVLALLRLAEQYLHENVLVILFLKAYFPSAASPYLVNAMIGTQTLLTICPTSQVLIKGENTMMFYSLCAVLSIRAETR